jgi:hypothetical protein
MHRKLIWFLSLGILVSGCSPPSSHTVEPIQNPTLPATWTPKPMNTQALSLLETSENETQMDEDELDTTLVPTPESELQPSTLPIFKGGDQWLVTIPGIKPLLSASTHDGGTLLLGQLTKRDGPGSKVIFKLSSQGEILWERIIQPDTFDGILEVADGGVVLVGIRGLTKLDPDGHIEWEEYLVYDQDTSPFIGSFYNYQSSRILGSGQTVMLDSYSINSLDYSGSLLSQLAMLSDPREGQSSIWLTTQAKWTAGKEGRSSLWVMRESPSAPAWLRLFDFQNLGSSIGFSEMHILGTQDGGAVLVASVRNLIRPSFAIWVVRMDRSGNILWQTALDGVDEFDLMVQETLDGGFIIASNAGHWKRDLSGYYLRILRINTSGDLQWDNFVGDGKWRVVPKTILNTMDGGYLITGEVVAHGKEMMSEAGDLVLLKVDRNGQVEECPWIQQAPYSLPISESPSTTHTSLATTSFSTADLYIHSYQPQSLEISDGFDNFSTHCIFPVFQVSTPTPSPLATFPVTPGKPPALDEENLHPIAIADGTFIGASRGGDWVSANEALDTISGTVRFQLYSTLGYLGEAQGVIKRATETGVCSGSPTIAFSSQPVNLGSIAFSVDWNAQPRKISELDPSLVVYQEVLGDYLESSGINNPNLQINSIVKADLDGDGLEEVIMTASWYEGGLSNRGVASGDYSVVFLRKIFSGEVRTFTMIEKIYHSAIGAIIPISYQTVGILDLNGDDVMEIILKGSSGAGVEYVVIDTTLSIEVPVLQITCNAP